MKLSVCLVAYYSDQELITFLEGFSDYRPDCLHEVIIVNNGSHDDQLKKTLQDRFGDWVHLLHSSKNLGFGAAQNRAVQHAKGEYVFICNPDLEVRDESLSLMVNFADELKDFGIIGPKLYSEDGDVQSSCRRFPTFFDLVIKRCGLARLFPKRMNRYLMKNRSLTRPAKVDWLVGAAMLMRRDRFLEIGGFDKRFFLFFEDTDLCRRMKEAGYDVWYHPEFEFVHSKERLSARGLWPFRKVFWIHFSSALKYFWKWKGK